MNQATKRFPSNSSAVAALAGVLALLIPGCAFDGSEIDPGEGLLGEAQQDLNVGTTVATQTATIGFPGDRYTHAINLIYGGTCTFKTTLGSLSDSVMWVYDSSGHSLGYNNDSGSLASRVDASVDPGAYTVVVGGNGSATGSYTLSVSCVDPVFFHENFVGNGDASQCNALAYGALDAPMGAWTSKVRIDADGRAGGCQQQFGVTDPLGLVTGLALNVNFYANGDAGQCWNSGNHPIPVSSSGPQWSSPYVIDTDNRAGGCYQVFSLNPGGPNDVVLDVEFLPDGDGAQCVLSGTQTVSRSRSATFLIDTDNRAGGCTERFRLRRCAARTSCNAGECGAVSDGCGGTIYCGSCSYCGDGICQSNESASTCPTDCGSGGSPCALSAKGSSNKLPVPCL